MRYKRIIALLLTLLLIVFALASCQKNNQGSVSPAEDSGASSGSSATPDLSVSDPTASVSVTPGEPVTPSISETKTSAEETEGLIFAVEEVSGKAGEQVVVPVTLSGSEKLTGFSVTVSYDKDKLELVEEQCKISGFSVSNKTVPGRIRLMCTTYSDFSLETDCTVWTLTFRIKEGTAGESIPLTIGIDDEKDKVFVYTDKGTENRKCSFVVGAVTVD